MTTVEQESREICVKIIDQLEQDAPELSKSLGGDLFFAYEILVQAELDKMREAYTFLKRAME